MASSSGLKRQMASGDTLKSSAVITASLRVPHYIIFSKSSTPSYDIEFMAGESIGTLANFRFDVRVVDFIGDSTGDGIMGHGILMTLRETLRADWKSQKLTFPEKLHMSLQIDIIDGNRVVESFPTKGVTFCSHNHIWTKLIENARFDELRKCIFEEEDGNVIFKIKLTLHKNLSEDGKRWKKDMKDELDLDFAVALETGLGSDLTIRTPLKLGGEQYAETKVNKGILSIRSSAFASMFSKMENKTDNVITIDDLTQKGLRVLLKYIYSAEVSMDWTKVAVELLNAAKKYGFLELETFLSQNFMSAITVENVDEYFSHAQKLEMKEIESKIEEFTEKNAKQLLQKLTKK